MQAKKGPDAIAFTIYMKNKLILFIETQKKNMNE